MRSFKLKPLKVGVSKARGGKNYGRKKRSEKKKRAEKHKVERDKALDELKELNKKVMDYSLLQCLNNSVKEKYSIY